MSWYQSEAKIQKRTRVKQQQTQPQINIQVSQKHGLPAFLSLIIPGLGQIIKGNVIMGIVYMIFTPIGYMFFVIPGIILHIVAIYDAYNGNDKSFLGF